MYPRALLRSAACGILIFRRWCSKSKNVVGLSHKSLDAMGVNVDVLPGLKDEKAGNCVDLPAAK
jgi:outer membrane usher protein FimD/PapC